MATRKVINKLIEEEIHSTTNETEPVVQAQEINTNLKGYPLSAGELKELSVKAQRMKEEFDDFNRIYETDVFSILDMTEDNDTKNSLDVKRFFNIDGRNYNKRYNNLNWSNFNINIESEVEKIDKFINKLPYNIKFKDLFKKSFWSNLGVDIFSKYELSIKNYLKKKKDMKNILMNITNI